MRHLESIVVSGTIHVLRRASLRALSQGGCHKGVICASGGGVIGFENTAR